MCTLTRSEYYCTYHMNSISARKYREIHTELKKKKKCAISVILLNPNIWNSQVDYLILILIIYRRFRAATNKDCFTAFTFDQAKKHHESKSSQEKPPAAKNKKSTGTVEVLIP